MIAAWMLYCALWTAWSSATAWMIERVVLRGRAAVRGLWIGAMVVSIGGPAVGYVFSHRPTPQTAVPVQGVEFMRVTGSSPQPHVASPTPATIDRATVELQRLVARADRPLAALWMLLSLAVLVYIGGGVAHLHFLRRDWRRGVVNDVDVMISDDTGPALVGVFRSTIVIPEWALDLEPWALSLLLQHELEHRRAGDARLLALAQVALATAPWNPLLWWQLRRLRLAVELDCDARVLGVAPDVRSYGQLLLEVGRPRRDIRFAGAALADHATHLEQRILAMTRGRRGTAKHAVLGSVVAGVLAVVVGCQMPAPATPAPSATRPTSNATAAVRDSATNTRDTAFHVLNRRYGRVDFNQTVGGALANRDSASARHRREDYLDRPPTEASFRFDDSVYARMSRETRALEKLLSDIRRDSTFPRVGLRRDDSLAIAELSRTIGCAGAPDRCPLRAVAMSDSVDAERLSPGCSASAGPTDSVFVKLLVSNADVERGGSVTVNAVAKKKSGAYVGYADDGMTCSARDSGLLRIYGKGSIVNRDLVVGWGGPTVIVVTNSAGRVLAGPVTLFAESRKFEMSWPGR